MPIDTPPDLTVGHPLTGWARLPAPSAEDQPTAKARGDGITASPTASTANRSADGAPLSRVRSLADKSCAAPPPHSCAMAPRTVPGPLIVVLLAAGRN
jgi:hypothetical protein